MIIAMINIHYVHSAGLNSFFTKMVKEGSGFDLDVATQSLGDGGAVETWGEDGNLLSNDEYSLMTDGGWQTDFMSSLNDGEIHCFSEAMIVQQYHDHQLEKNNYKQVIQMK